MTGARFATGLRFASIYCGCGGLDLGFALAGFEPIWANDIDDLAVATHNSVRLLGGHAVSGALLDVPWPEPHSADLVVGGPPCQGFSVAGKRDPHDPRSQELWTFLEFVRHIQPSAFVMENVKSLATSPRWNDLRQTFVRRARAMGYRAIVHVLDASDYGVPQRRERMFIIGTRGCDPPPNVGSAQARKRSAGAVLLRLPPFGSPGNDTLCTARVQPAKLPVMRRSPYHGSLLFNGSGRPLRLDGVACTLPASMGGNCTPIVDQRELETGAEPWVVWYHRYLAGGGQPLQAAPEYVRRITVEEAAALQGFPRSYPWKGGISARFRHIGNSVPPPLAYHVALAVADTLGVRPNGSHGTSKASAKGALSP